MPIRCGFEAETFWYGAEDSGSGYDIDDMTLDEVDSEFGIPDAAYEDYDEHVREKAYDDGYVGDSYAMPLNIGDPPAYSWQAGLAGWIGRQAGMTGRQHPSAACVAELCCRSCCRLCCRTCC